MQLFKSESRETTRKKRNKKTNKTLGFFAQQFLPLSCGTTAAAHRSPCFHLRHTHDTTHDPTSRVCTSNHHPAVQHRCKLHVLIAPYPSTRPTSRVGLLTPTGRHHHITSHHHGRERQQHDTAVWVHRVTHHTRVQDTNLGRQGRQAARTLPTAHAANYRGERPETGAGGPYTLCYNPDKDGGRELQRVCPPPSTTNTLNTPWLPPCVRACVGACMEKNRCEPTPVTNTASHIRTTSKRTQ